MPPRGATSAKVGQRFEDRWTAHTILKILKAEAEWIYLERIDTGETGFEFEIATGESVEHHQVKRQISGDSGWRLKDLRVVLQAFRSKLEDPHAVCVFASGNAAQVLDDLSIDARNAADYDTFKKGVLSVDTRKRQFDELAEIWDTDELWVFSSLQRVRVATIGEDELTDLLALECELVMEGPTASAPDVLIQILRDRVNQRVTAVELWSDLAKVGLTPNPWHDSPELVSRIRAVNDRFVGTRRNTLIGGELIRRPEAQAIRKRIDTQPAVLVEGTAGAGKSDVLLQFVGELEDAAIPHLVFRLDRWQSTDSPEELGAQMKLPVSPTAALAVASQGQPCVLVVDQLDAVSTTAGRQSAFLDCVDLMVRAAATQPNMRVVVACRSFDVRNDARLRGLVSNESPAIRITELSPDQVDEVLTQLDANRPLITTPLLELLRVPLHLYLFSTISPVAPEDLPSITTLRDLYDEFWKVKRRKVTDRLGREPHWTEVLQALVDDMNHRATLRSPMELLDPWEADRDEMLSESVLTEDADQIAFFHETFFDYAFARLFSRQGLTVRDLLAADQLLFRRAQVRQLLDYERRGSTDRYVEDLRYLLLDDAVRFHIRDLVLSWLGTVETPTDAEWELLDELLATGPPAVVRRIHHTISTAAWFGYLDAKGLIEAWLADGDSSGLALSIIAVAQPASPERAAELLTEHQARNAQAAEAVSAVLQRTDLSESREAFDMFIRMLETDEHELGRRDFFYLAHNLAERHPDWGCELLGAYLRNRLRAADEQKVINPFDLRAPLIPRELYIHDLIEGSARDAPKAFVEHVLPQMLTIISRTGQPEYSNESELVRDAVWHTSRIYRHRDSVDDDLLAGAETALSQLSRQDPAAFSVLVEEHCDTEYETVCSLLFGGFAANPEVFADRASEFILADLRRLNVGRSSDDHWATRELLLAITPHCSTDSFERLEAVVLAYYTQWERSHQGRRARGGAQFTLLDAMDPSRRSELGRRRLLEWQRKFGTDKPPEPSGVQGGMVGSPIPSDATRKMRDWQWLRAFDRYDSDDSGRRDFLKGGAHQLSQELEGRAKEDPARFIGLAAQMRDDTHVYYFDALLRGVAGSEHDVSLAATRVLIERCHQLPGRPCGRWIAHPLQRHRGAPLPHDLAEILSWYAINDPDPPEVSEDFSGDISDEERVELQGLNSVRGSVAYEVAVHIHSHEENVGPFMAAIEALVHDVSAAVRGMTVRTLTALMRHQSSRAVDLFVDLASHPDDRILAGRETHEFLRYAAREHFDILRPVLERMVASDLPVIRTRGAVQAAIVGLDGEHGQDLVERCLRGDEAHRLGVAQVNAANITQARYRSRCEEQLAGAFDDDDEKVRTAASTVFRELSELNFADADELVDAFLSSRAFDAEGSQALLHGLEMADAPPPALSLRVAGAFLGAEFASGEAAGGRMAVHDVAELAARAYADANDLEGKNAALDVIDGVVALDTFRIARALAEYER
ncbi:MAG: hypothetical protein ACJ762_16350 [Solirubrobacteraceae bacterium]